MIAGRRRETISFARPRLKGDVRSALSASVCVSIASTAGLTDCLRLTVLQSSIRRLGETVKMVGQNARAVSKSGYVQHGAAGGITAWSDHRQLRLRDVPSVRR